MKTFFVLLIYFFLITKFIHCQTTEQRALNFFADSIIRHNIPENFKICLSSKIVQDKLPQSFWFLAGCYAEIDSSLYKVAEKTVNNTKSSEILKKPKQLFYGLNCNKIPDSLRISLTVHKSIQYNDTFYTLLLCDFIHSKGDFYNIYFIVTRKNRIVDYCKSSVVYD